ncbi:ABC-type transport auxiliary lipoprotein family protein [Sulfurimonas sp.]|uniref:ABC-type transport auxiliary lipoprotein family protein n=1 Tax=Sulfurimonas sp. TaxID=2022749 RepID=UPI002AAF59F5|nr:ABC-type transport auxiliary lipoprotein family protein [Sulfurimonas sp.]
MIKIFLIALGLAVLTGCTTIEPPVAEYKLSVKSLEQIDDLSNGCKEKSLKVSQAFSSSSLMSLKMNYVQNKHKIYSYSQAQWNNSVNQEITSQVVKVLRESNLFKNTQTSKSRSKSDLILEINIEDFMQYFTNDSTKSYVNVAISITVIDSKTSEVLATSSFKSKNKVDSLDAKGGVKAFEIVLREVLTKSINFLNKVCE